MFATGASILKRALVFDGVSTSAIWRTASNRGTLYMQGRCFTVSHTWRQEDNEWNMPEEGHYQTFVRDIFTSGFLAGVGHAVAVIQPLILFGPQRHEDIDIKLMLDEVKALVESLPNWRVADVLTVPVKSASTEYPQIFGSGNMQMLASRISCSKKVTVAFVNLSSLKPSQYALLHDALRIPIYDRYTLVLEIFRTYAKTKEAKAQVGLAELQYLKVRLGRTHSWDADPKALVGGSVRMQGASFFTNDHKLMMQARESTLKKELAKLRDHRDRQRKQKHRENVPIVSVVGYTNAGKTSLIRCLTQDRRLVPEDRLFATLAVSVHEGQLPSKLRVLYADTIGFIADIPTNLVAAFKAMLNEVRYSTQLIHIRDMSHPNHVAQKETVMSTLRSLELPPELMSSIIEVWNKVDLVQKMEAIDESIAENTIPTSCINGKGLTEIQIAVDKNLLSQEDMCLARFLVSNGGEELRFLYSECTVRDATPTESGDKLIVTTIAKRHTVDQFLKRFGNLLYRQKKSESHRN